MDVSSPGPLCEELGLCGEILVLDTIGLMPTIDQKKITKGVVLELNQFRKGNNLSWNHFHAWMIALYSRSTLPSLSVIRSSIYRIENKVKQLKRNHHNDDIIILTSEPFITACNKDSSSSFGPDDEHACSNVLTGTDQTVLAEAKTCSDSHELEVLTTVNKELAGELSKVQNKLEHEVSKTDDLTTKLSKLSVRNTNKKLKRRDEKINELKEQVKDKEKLQHNLQQATTRVRSYQNKLTVATNKYDSITQKCDHLQMVTKDLNEELELATRSLCDSENKYDCMLERLQELQCNTFESKVHQMKYLDNVRQCCIELLSLNVGVKNVEPIIRCVLKHIASFEIKELPQKSTLIRMFAEMKGLSCQQLSEELQKEDNLTLHSDGTSKFGQHYYSFQVSTSHSTYSLGLAEMLSGTATQVLSTFQQILSDVEVVAESGSGNAILSKIKNTMSDRHIVEKKFNTLLEGYRLEILPSVIDNWNEMNTDEQQSIGTLNNFFCGLHLLVGMADTASSALLQWEQAHFEECVGASALPNSFKKSESGVIRLVRTACKALCKHASEQSGVYQPFTSFLKSKGINRNPLVSFRGNRFNIVFYDAGALYYIAEHVINFFKEVWQTPNQLLKAVFSDIQVPEFVAGCRALGLINKIITGPFWRVVECSDVTILEMNSYFDTLIRKLDTWSQDASILLQGHAELYTDYPPKKDEIWNQLITPTEFDYVTQEVLEVLCHSFSALLSRLVEDHLPGGTHYAPSAQLTVETVSVSKSNVVSERDFGKLDRLLREKPNATTLSLEAMVLFSSNKTMKWLNTKSAEEVEHLLQIARKKAPEFKKLFKQRREDILEGRIKALHEKQHALDAARRRGLKRKEKLTEDIVRYGLWQTKEDIVRGVAKQRSNTAKLNALKAQLNFRKQVLDQKSYLDKDLFLFSKNGKQYSADKLVENLTKLICDKRSVQERASYMQESLVGKKIKHKWRDENGCEKWYCGEVLSKVIGTEEWYNVQYEGEEDVLTLNLHEDFDLGDLEVVS
ncbi:uncharacterized protein [Dysidea avara]|uniref:uncharacterized protein n=1 Tax=Dysidea avara TaxID=196820 RepID=UPI00331B13E3